MIFNKRESAPSKDDKHYYSNNIFYKSGFGMPNCTTYAWGRFYELLEQLGIEGTPKLQTSNAENWYVDEKTYEKGQTPRLGAVIVWKKGRYHNPSDGAGHVGVVEELKEDGSIVVSQSAYQGKEFYLTEHNNRYEKSSYQFDGFIYLPGEFENAQKNEDIVQNEISKDEECTTTDTFNIGDKVLVLNGYITSDSYGGGNHTAVYDGDIHPEDISNYLIITNIQNDGRPRPIHLRRTDERGATPMGWATLEQIKKI